MANLVRLPARVQHFNNFTKENRSSPSCGHIRVSHVQDVMPRVWKPREHSLYRIASIALYRALLTQCRAANPLSAEQRLSAANIVRNRFKANATEVSVRRTKNMYLAGYHALDLLDDCVAGLPAATSRITQLLSATPNDLKQAAAPRVSRAERRRQRQQRDGHDPSTLACPPPGQKMLDVRPRARSEFASGARRHVPRYAVANKLPFLRIRKPQPANLERVLRQKLRTRQRRVDWSHVLQGFYVPLAAMEDRWDALLEDADSVGLDGEPRWEDVMREELRVLHGRMSEDNQKTWEMAKRMQEVVDQERELAEKEAREDEALTLPPPSNA